MTAVKDSPEPRGSDPERTQSTGSHAEGRRERRRQDGVGLERGHVRPSRQWVGHRGQESAFWGK